MTAIDDPWADENRPADDDELAAAEDRYAAQFGWTREGNERDTLRDDRASRGVETEDGDDLGRGEDEYDGT